MVEFKQTSITVNENLAFNIGVKVTNYNNASLAVSMTTTDPKLDIVETKFTGPNQTLKTLYQKGIIKDQGHSNSAALQNSSAEESGSALENSGSEESGSTAGDPESGSTSNDGNAAGRLCGTGPR